MQQFYFLIYSAYMDKRVRTDGKIELEEEERGDICALGRSYKA